MNLKTASFAGLLTIDSVEEVSIETLICGYDLDEERSKASADMLSTASVVQLHLKNSYSVEVVGTDESFNIYESDEIDSFIAGQSGRIAVDITGLEHKVWAPVFRALVESERSFVVLYTEPGEYKKSQEPFPGVIYDLSSRIEGIEPLPGFVSIASRSRDDSFFAALLGFEGPRLDHVVDQENVDLRRMFPIIGSPGFRVEYPSYAYLAHESIFVEAFVHSRVGLARASDPFEAYEALSRIHDIANHRHLYIAPLGTKPHALGAILFAIRHPATTEIVYDHPVRSKNRTVGVGNMHIYDVSEFLLSDQV